MEKATNSPKQRKYGRSPAAFIKKNIMKIEYLKRIIETVQAALKLQSAAPAPAKEQWGMAA